MANAANNAPFQIEQLVLDFTRKCNGRCAYCGIWRIKNGPELTLKAIENVFTAPQLKGLKLCSVTGGEPYISDKIIDIAALLHKHIPDCLLATATNGIQCEKILQRTLKIRDTGCKIQVNVSLNGTQYTHDVTRGQFGYWNKAVTLVDQLIANGISTIVVFGIMPHTIKDLSYAQKFCAVRGINMEFAWAQQSERYGKVNRTFITWPEVTTKPNLRLIENLPDYFDCPALRKQLVVSPDGSVHPCEMYLPELLLGNVDKKPLEDILNDPHTFDVAEMIAKRGCSWCQGPGEAGGTPKWMLMDRCRRQSPQAMQLKKTQHQALYMQPEQSTRLITEVTGVPTDINSQILSGPATASYQKAQARTKVGKINDDISAIRDFEKLLRIYPNYVPLLLELGELYYWNTNIAKATPLFNKACSLDPTSDTAWKGLVNSLIAAGQKNLAMKALNLWLKARPGSRDALDIMDCFKQQQKLIHSLHNRHKGQRAFILGNGPSLLDFDLSLLKDETTFGVNGLCDMPSLPFAPTYYCVADIRGWKKWDTKITRFPSLKIISVPPCKNVPQREDFLRLPLNWHQKVHHGYFAGTTETLYQTHLGWTVILDICLQLAYYMGFSEVYLLGVDLTARDGRMHAYDPKTEGVRWTNDSFEGLIESFRFARQVYERAGREIYNLSPASKLDVFEKRDFMSVVGASANSKSKPSRSMAQDTVSDDKAVTVNDDGNSSCGNNRDNHMPDISVLLCSYNRADTLERCLQALQKQTLHKDRFEIICVNDGSTDNTREVMQEALKRLPGSYHEHTENRGLAAARNTALQTAKGKYLLFINDDTIAALDMLEQHLKAHKSHPSQKLAVLGDFRFSPQLLEHKPALRAFNETTLIFAYAKMTQGQTYNYMHFWTANVSVPRDAYEKIGRFDETYRRYGVEDTEWGYRLEQAGFQVLYYPAAHALHDHDMSSIENFCQRQRHVAANFATFFRNHPEALTGSTWTHLRSVTRSKLCDELTKLQPKLTEVTNSAKQLAALDLQNAKNYGTDPETIITQMKNHLFWLHEFYYSHLGRLEGLEAEGVESFKQFAEEKTQPPPKISIIIPTYNRSTILLKCLTTLAKQTLPADEFEVLVCDDGSTDDTQAIVKGHSAPYKLHYLRQENRGPAAARNMGIRQAKGQYLLFINDDTITDCDLLKAHLQSQQNHHKEKVAILGTFSFLPAHKQQSPFLCFLEEKGLLFRCVKHNTYYNFRYFWTCNISISKKAVIDAGLFDEDFKNAAAEDVELGYRLYKNGYKVFYDENCVAHHDHKISPESFFRKRQVMAAQNALLVAVKHPELAKEMIGLDSLNNNSLTNFKKRTVPSIEKNIETYLQMLTNLDNRPRDYTYDPEVSSKSFLPLFKALNSYWCAKGIIEGAGQYITNDKEALQTNNNHQPKISIIVPTYNYAHFIRQCLESILCQTHKDYEVIIMDDNSSDDTENIVQSFLADKRIKYVKNKANLQQPRNCNKALLLAEGQFICFLHADDVFMPQNLEKKLQVLEKKPHIAAVFSGVYLIDEKGDIKKELKHQGRPDHDYFGSRDDYHDLMKYNYIPTPSDVLIRKECLERVGGFNEKLINGCDWELWIRLAKNSKLAFIKEPLIGYRLHPANLHSELRRKNDVVVKDHFWIIDSIFNNNNIDTETTKNRDNAYMQIARTISEIPESYRKLYSDALKIRINPSILHNGESGKIEKLSLSRQLEYAAECQKNEDHIGAVKIYLKLLQSKDADLIAVSYALGETWMKLLKFPEAVSSFNNILENNESYPAAYQHLGKSYHQLNMYDQAETAYRRAIEMLPQDYSIRKHLAELYLEQWKLDAAINELQIYLKLCPNDTKSVRLLEECHSTKHLLSKPQNKTKTKNVTVEKSINVEKYHTTGKTKVALFRSYFTRPLYKALMSYPEITPVLVDDLEEMRKMLKDLQVDAVVTPRPELIEDTPKSIFSFLINHGLADKNYTSESRVIKGHNAYLVAGEELKNRALRTQLYDEEHIRLIGYLPFDYLFTETFPDRDKFLEEMNLDPSKKTVLYAPTWNGLGNYSSLFSHGEQIVKAVPEKYNLIIKYHWNILREVEQKKNGFEQFHLIENYANKRENTIILSAGEILKCINACDVLIADTSSVVLEAMCLDKPVIFWDKAERTTLYRIDKQARDAGITVTSQAELVNAVELSIHNPKHLAENRKKIAAKASLPLDGKCGERAAHAVYELLVQNKKVLSLGNKDTHLTELAEHYLKELVVK